MVTIDHGRCRRDGICATVCPMKLFVTDSEGYPQFREDAPERCIRCGHCVAVCHRDAISHSLLPETETPLVDRAQIPSPAATAQLIKARRSIRAWRPEPVPQELIASAIDAARWSPTAVNQQPVHWLVITDPAEVQRMAGLVIEYLRSIGPLEPRYAGIVKSWDKGNDPIMRNAPHLVVLHAANDWAWSAVDTAITLTTFELAAVSLGAGTCWAGFLMWAAREYAPLREALCIPEGHGVYGAMMLGMPKFSYYRSPPRNEAPVVWR